METEEKIVSFDDPEAAKFVTDIKGWVSRSGIFCGNKEDSERIARYDGCTHRPCQKCGTLARKHYTLCDSCRSIADKERYIKMPEAEWDGKAMLYSNKHDKYFSETYEIEGFLEELNTEESDKSTIEDLQLIICKPNYARQLDEDFFVDEMYEDQEIPEELVVAVNKFNMAVSGIILSYSPGKYRLKIAS